MPTPSTFTFSTSICPRRVYHKHMPRHSWVRKNVLFIFASVTLLCGGNSYAEQPEFFKGVTVSCQTWGIEWQTPEMAQTLDELKSLGVNSVAIHPYARIENDGHVTSRNIDNGAGGGRATSTGKPARVDEPGGESINYRHITVPLDWARERGMSVMLIPHIGYWGWKFSWRGEIIFNTMVEWDRFFADYERWMVEM